MSDLLFQRTADLVFGVRTSPGKEFFYGKIDPRDGREIPGPRIKFDVEKTSEPTPNKAKIAIYNLSKDTRALAEAPGVIVALKAGYQGRNETIFVGDAARVISYQEGADVVTEFEASDGQDAYETAKVDLSFGPGATSGQIMESMKGLMRDAGLAIGEFRGVPNKSYLNGYAASGMVRDQLDELTQSLNLEWSIQDGALEVRPIGERSQESIIIISAETGLIGSPKKKGESKEKGLEIVSLLQPKVKPGRAIVVRSLSLKRPEPLFRVLKVRHQGDTHGDEWYSRMEVQ